MAFMGQDGFVWAIGVIEDRFDPEKLGRVRVRWLGYHTEDKQKILTKDLPWAQVMQSVGGNSMAGVGDAPVNLVEGSWVVGFFRDPDSLQDPIVIGTMPGMNTTTALAGGGGKKWGQSRGQYKTFEQPQNYGDNKTIAGSETQYKDFEKGFFDPTYDQADIPHPPSELTSSSAKGYAEVPSEYILFDYTDANLYPRVLNWSPELIKDIIPDADPPLTIDQSGSAITLSEKINPGEWSNLPSKPALEKSPSAPTVQRITHSDLLHAMFKTTRRVVSDARLPINWTKMGTMKWPDTMTYSKDGADKEPFFRIGETESNPESSDSTLVASYERLAGVDRQNFIITTGYLEDGFWRDSTTQLPSYPWTRDMANNSAGSDSRPSDLQTSETGQFGQSGEWYRTTHPRVKYVKKGSLTATQTAQAKLLYDSGHYGTGTYEMNDDPNDPVGRQDIKWDDIGINDLVVVQVPDTNALAMGGIPIASITSSGVVTKSGFFTGATTGTGKNAKPEIAAGDIVQIAGCRGSQELNGRIFKVLSVSGTDALTFSLGTADGGISSGPGGTAIGTSTLSAYINGGVVLIDPHPVLQYKAETRERQINIGSPNAETGLTSKYWNQPSGDFNAQYPYNHVYESESGHLREFDDTPGAERIHEYHRAGTYYEVDHAGNKVDYVKGDRYDISMHDDYVYVKGRVVHTYDDEVLIRCNDRLDLSSKWKMQIWSGGDLDIHSKRNINLKSDGDINLQADGHINMQGTTLTPEQAKFKAGSRGVFEMSKIRMKAGHFEAEMVGDEGHPDAMGIALQSNIAPIQIKTVQEGKSIFITSAEDIEMFANVDFYRTAWTGKMFDYAYTDYNLTAVIGNLEILASGTTNNAIESADGNIRITGKQRVDIEACKDDLNLTAGWKDINLKALASSDPVAAGGNINVQAIKNSNIKSGVFSLTADNAIQIKSVNKEINIEAVKDTDGIINVKAAEDIFIESADAMNIKVGEKLYLESTSDMHLKSGGAWNSSSTNAMSFGANGLNLISSGITYITGTAVNLNNGGSATAPTAATGSGSASPNAADTAAIASVGTPAYIAETMTLLVTDLPNPVPSDPPLIDADSHGLALNKNDPVTAGSGTGGENIRNLEDLLSDMSSGIVAHTLVPSVDVGAQGEWVGTKTTDTAGKWDGYSDELESTAYILGKRSYSTIRRYHGWVADGDDTAVTWNCTIDSTR